ncbi:DUF5908 family protein [Derxia lacustris]|uniref:DUF5908 family protein n=1 Tax=Derxia lacustris TaxID=764842 RepID=UPI00159397BB|nr:DUF5908 family protein [Derxia lacustris]
MTIEIRQMTIRSTVNTRPQGCDADNCDPPADKVEDIRREILAECRLMLQESLREMRER